MTAGTLRRLGAGLGLVLGILLGFVAYAGARYDRPPAERAACDRCDPAVAVLGHVLHVRRLPGEPGRAPLVVVHGGPGHSSASFGRSLDALAPGREVLLYDQRGSGRSSASGREADYTVEALVDELEAVRRDVLRAPRIALLGHSFGGALVQRYALAHPDRVERMILVGSIRVNNGMSPGWLWRRLGPALWALGLGFPPADPEAATAWFAGATDDDSTRLHDPRRARELLSQSGTTRFTTWRALSRSVMGPDHHDELRALRVPTLVVVGAADSPYTGEKTGRVMCALLPVCRLEVFPASGHWPFLEEPERFLTSVEGFLRGNP